MNSFLINDVRNYAVDKPENLTSTYILVGRIKMIEVAFQFFD